MGRFGLLDRFCIPTYNDPEQMEFGIVEIDYGKCTRCSLCAGACPAGALIIVDKQPRTRKAPENECAFCGDCAAICPVGAITMKSPYIFTKFYKTINHVGVSPPRL
jgi:formate hydrogenlyase subunit 6/NADH:ubiquinone oxidoreductase subunit I